ncbi:unnamed protein product [Ambrosiozyma monospora]|uniref:Unnamed protein product n=1 Tax=Ambrosiozyma monospora TaxID=43982 RepID=A0ACB5SSM0_AMBMO|nr:unnamed protein product [Ambrosiozyma monospora]
MSGNNKRRHQMHSDKSSDRRLAAGSQANVYLHSKEDIHIKDSKHLQNSLKLLNQINNKSKEENDPNNRSSGPTKAVEMIDPKTGKKWLDKSLVSWDPSHFRLFIGNLSDEATEEQVFRTFVKYPSLSQVKVPKHESKPGMNKGYGFVSFADPDDYLQCFKECNGRFIGSKPIELKKAKSQIGKTVSIQNRKKKNKQKRKTLI